MKEITRIIDVEITFIDEFDNEDNLRSKDKTEYYIKKYLNADKVEIKHMKDFIVDKKRGKSK